MKKYSLLGFLLLLASSSFAQGKIIKGITGTAKAASKAAVPAVRASTKAAEAAVRKLPKVAPVVAVPAKSAGKVPTIQGAKNAARSFVELDRKSLGLAVQQAPGARATLPEVYRSKLTQEVEQLGAWASQTLPIEALPASGRQELSHYVVELSQGTVLSKLPAEEVESYGASLLLEKKVKGLNEGGLSFSEQVLRRPNNVPFSSADEVDFVLNGETLRLDRNSGADALQMARVLDLSVKEFGPASSKMTLEEYAVFNVLNQRFQKAYEAFKTEGVWQLDETVPVSKFNYSLDFADWKGFVPVLKESAPNNLVLKEAELTAELAGSMADFMLFMARGGDGWTFDDALQAFSNTMGFKENSLRDFIFRNSLNKIY